MGSKRRSPRRVPLVWLLCGVLGLTPGCALWPKKEGDAKSGKDTPWTESWRERSGNIKGFGFDSRAKEIERNLGVY